MSADDAAYRRYVQINLPHARTIVDRLSRSLQALGAFGEAGNGGAAALRDALGGLEAAAEANAEDPPFERALAAADTVAEQARALVEAVLASPLRDERLGRHVRNLFECLGLPEEGAERSLACGERADSPLR